MVSCLGRCTVPSSFAIVHNRMSSAPSASELQDFYSRGFASVRQDFELHQDGRGTVAALAALADELVARLYRAHFSNDLAGPSNACVVAVGGYGRSALFPHSDIDLLFLFESAEDARPYQEATAAICRALWDLRLKLGQSTHTLAEVDRLDQANPEFAIALLDCRYLAGDGELFAKLRNSVVPRLVLRERKDLLRTLAALTEARHAKYGDTIFHLEPNIKEAPGALRDYDVSRWLQVISQVQERKSGARNVVVAQGAGRFLDVWFEVKIVDDVHQLADRGVHPGDCSRSQAGSRVSRAVTGPFTIECGPRRGARGEPRCRVHACRSDHVLPSRRART